MCRVGSSRRVDPRLEPYLASDIPPSNSSSTITAGPSPQLRRLRAARVVGVTCASCPILEGQSVRQQERGVWVELEAGK